MDTNLSRQISFLIQQNTGIKLEKIIEQILESNLIYTNDLFEHENIKALNTPDGANKYYNTFYLFARQNYLAYRDNKLNFIELSDKMLQKLKIITLLDLVKDNKNIRLDILCNQLDITDSFELDSILFEAFSMGLITGKVDQKNKLLKVFSIKGRDYVPDLKTIEQKLDKWIDNLEKSSNYIMREVECLRNDSNVFGEHLHNKVTTINKIVDNNSKKVASDEQKTILNNI